MTHQHHAHAAEAIETPVSISRLLHTLRSYLPAIVLSLAAVAIAWLLIAIGTYLLAPSQRVMRQAFRLDFEGSQAGLYPNGTKFSAAELVSTPVLLDVYRANELNRFTSFKAFSDSVFVLESNPAYEALANAYQARLADPKLTPIDRERIQREFEDKRASFSKNEYALHLMRNEATARIPDTVARKTLSDILNVWAKKAVTEQQVLVSVPVLSPRVVDETPIERSDALIAVHVLRSKIQRLSDNIDILEKLPSAQLIRTSEPDGVLLAEIRMRLEDVIRFRLDPLLTDAGNVASNRAAAIRFVEAQLAYDQRELRAAQERAEAARQALVVYTDDGKSGTEAAGADRVPSGGTQEGVTPQLDASFLERLVAIASDNRDREYRQSLVNRYSEASLAAIPLGQAVAFDERTLEQLRAGGAGTANQAEVQQQIATMRAEVRQLIRELNLIHARITEHINPSTQLFTLNGTPLERVERTVSIRSLALGGVMVMLIGLTLAIAGALLHARVRQEEAAEAEELEEQQQIGRDVHAPAPAAKSAESPA